MKLMSFNLWGGHIFEPLMSFLAEQKDIVDVFCFQEVNDTDSDIVTDELRVNLLSEIKNRLPDHNCFFAMAGEGFNYFTRQRVDYDLKVGTAIFVRKNLKTENHQAPLIYGSTDNLNQEHLNKFPGDFPKLLQQIKVGNYWIFNIHGPWFPSNKDDNTVRLEYFSRVAEELSAIAGKKILCGDFNLNPNTQSMEILEDLGMRNLIKDFQIKTTRSKFYTWPIPFADYILTSEDIEVVAFEVLPTEASDHLPLVVEVA